jgi:hypothetical protein
MRVVRCVHQARAIPEDFDPLTLTEIGAAECLCFTCTRLFKRSHSGRNSRDLCRHATGRVFPAKILCLELEGYKLLKESNLHNGENGAARACRILGKHMRALGGVFRANNYKPLTISGLVRNISLTRLRFPADK